MPQIWLNYTELGDMFGSNAAAAAERVLQQGWARRRCSDGITRAKLPVDQIARYLEIYSEQAAGSDPSSHLVAALQEILDIARRPEIETAVRKVG